MDQLVAFLLHGLLSARWWQMLVYVLVTTHITIAAVTIFLHRAQAHRALNLHPLPEHFLRFWLWLTTGMVTKEWVAIHRKHHAKCETPDDPHSPQTRGIWKVLLEGSELYRDEAKNQETLEKYGQGTPDDWLEHHVYSRFLWHGVGALLIIDVLLFGVIGVTLWAVQMLWIPVLAAGVINGVGHYVGYRNFEAPDASTNIFPFGVIIGGEELHNNHHAYPTSAKLSARWYEIDVGWCYIRVLQWLHLAEVRKAIPKVFVDRWAEPFSLEALRAIQSAHLHVLARFDRLTKKLSPKTEEIRRLREELIFLWKEKTHGKFRTPEQLLGDLREWCRRAEESGIPRLKKFAEHLSRYRLRSSVRQS